MALPTLNWRKLAPVTLAANNVNAALDALYAAGNAATYADGSPRVQGQDCAWRWTGNFDNGNALQPGATTAVYCTPPTSFPGVTNPGTVIPQAILWCGSTNAPTATLRYAFPAAQIDARTPGMLYIGQCKNPGAYSNWNSATPFTSGQFTGCANAVFNFAGAVWNLLYMWESQEGVIVQFGRTSPQINTSWSGAGAILDPGSATLGETDGRLYGVFSTGANNYCSGSFWASTTDIPFNEGSTAGRERFGIFTPGTATISGYNRFGVTNPGTTFVPRSGTEIVLVPVYCNGSTAPSLLREIWLARDAYTNQNFSNGGPALGYIVGSFFATTAADVAILTV
jgi:hypothetical protein